MVHPSAWVSDEWRGDVERVLVDPWGIWGVETID